MSTSNAPQPKRGKKEEEPWYIVSTDQAMPDIFVLNVVRMWVDEMFRDLKGQSFHLDQIRLTDPERIDRLIDAVPGPGLPVDHWPPHLD